MKFKQFNQEHRESVEYQNQQRHIYSLSNKHSKEKYLKESNIKLIAKIIMILVYQIVSKRIKLIQPYNAKRKIKKTKNKK